MKKNSIFWPKAWVNPFGKMPVLRRWKIFFNSQKKFVFCLKHHSTPFLVLFDRKQVKKKNIYFDQKQGLTPLEKCHSWDFKKFRFYSQKRFLLYLKLYVALFPVLFWPKTNKEKKLHFFVQTHGLTSSIGGTG